MARDTRTISQAVGHDADAMDAVSQLLVQVDAGELGDPLPVLAYLAGEEVVIEGLL